MRRFPAAVGAVLILAAVALSGCVSGALTTARHELHRGNPEAAAEALADADTVSRRDRLLYYMEKGVVLHHLGRYEESSRVLLAASRLMEEQEVISASRQTASMVTNDWVTEYKGEYSERLWVHTYLMMNFLLSYRFDAALVEAKQALKMMEAHPEALAGDYYTRALIGLCFEVLRDRDDAYIAYRKLAEDLPDPSGIAPVLYRLARRLGYGPEADRYRRMIPAGARVETSGPTAELVLFVSAGQGPVKIPGNIVLPPSIRFSFPQYRLRNGPAVQVLAYAEGRPLQGVAVTTDVGAVARAALDARAAAMMAKETARAALKEAVARAVEHNNDDIFGILVRAAFFLMEEPDTRGWETLPGTFQLARFIVPAGADRLTVRVTGGGTRTEIPLTGVRAAPGGWIFRSVRVSR